MKIVHFDARAGRDGHVGEHGARDLGGQGADRPLDVFAGANVLGSATRALGEPVEQIGVDVVTDAEREHPELAATLLGALGDPFGIGFPRAGLAIGQEYDHAQGLLCRGLRECLRERAGDVGAALGIEAANPICRVTPRLSRHAGPFLRVAAHAARKCDQPEPVTCAQRAEQLNQRGFGLLNFLAGHRAGDVDDGDQIAPQRRGVGRGTGRQKQHEVAVFADGMMGNE